VVAPVAPAPPPHINVHAIQAHAIATAPVVPTAAEPAPVPSPVVTPDDASVLYARAEAALARGDREAAQAAWTELIARFPASPLVASARFDLARVARDRGDLALAREQLAQLLAGTPPTALAEPAGYLACRIEVERAAADAAAGCFTAFRAAFPRSPHDAEVLAWLAGHVRASGGCASARALAEEYLRRYPTGPFAARARECAP
jgi:TolA-binding protein